MVNIQVKILKLIFHTCMCTYYQLSCKILSFHHLKYTNVLHILIPMYKLFFKPIYSHLLITCNIIWMQVWKFIMYTYTLFYLHFDVVFMKRNLTNINSLYFKAPHWYYIYCTDFSTVLIAEGITPFGLKLFLNCSYNTEGCTSVIHVCILHTQTKYFATAEHFHLIRFHH